MVGREVDAGFEEHSERRTVHGCARQVVESVLAAGTVGQEEGDRLVAALSLGAHAATRQLSELLGIPRGGALLRQAARALAGGSVVD